MATRHKTKERRNPRPPGSHNKHDQHKWWEQKDTRTCKTETKKMEDKSDISVPPEIETKVQEGVYEETVRQRESTADPKPFWHFSEHRKWGATPQGQRELAKYPQVKPRTEEEEAKHEAFGKRIFARYASN